MGLIFSILTSLGVDYTMFIQLTIFLLFYPAMRALWLLDMEKILARRREVGLQGPISSMDMLQKEIDKINSEYRLQVDQLYTQAHQKLQQQKQDFERSLVQEYNLKKIALDNEKRGKLQLLKEEIISLREETLKEKMAIIQPLLHKFDH